MVSTCSRAPGAFADPVAICTSAARRFHIGNAQRPRGFQFLQHQGKRIRPPQFRDRVDGHRIGCGIEATVHLPLQHAEGSRCGAVEALGRPGDPVLLVLKHIQSQEFAAIVHAVPADGAVAIGRDHQSAITGDVDRPGYARHSALP